MQEYVVADRGLFWFLLTGEELWYYVTPKFVCLLELPKPLTHNIKPTPTPAPKPRARPSEIGPSSTMASPEYDALRCGRVGRWRGRRQGWITLLVICLFEGSLFLWGSVFASLHCEINYVFLFPGKDSTSLGYPYYRLIKIG